MPSRRDRPPSVSSPCQQVPCLLLSRDKRYITEVHQLFTIVDQRFTALQERYADYLSCLLLDDDETPEADSHWIEGSTAAFMKAKMDF